MTLKGQSYIYVYIYITAKVERLLSGAIYCTTRCGARARTHVHPEVRERDCTCTHTYSIACESKRHKDPTVKATDVDFLFSG